MVVGAEHVVSVGSKSDWIQEFGSNFIVILGPSETLTHNGNCNSNTGNAKNKPSNSLWKNFGEAIGENKVLLENLADIASKGGSEKLSKIT